MPPVSQPAEKHHHYGRSIPESEPEEVVAETVQVQQRRSDEKGRHRGEASSDEDPLIRQMMSLLIQESGETASLHTHCRGPLTTLRVNEDRETAAGPDLETG